VKAFTDLFLALDQTTRTTAKVAALAAYLGSAPDDDRLWTIAILSGRRPKRAVTTAQLRVWAAEVAEVPDWLFEESYGVVGDLAETISLLLPVPTGSDTRSLTEWIGAIRTLGPLDETARRDFIVSAWNSLPPEQRFVFNKLITGGFRVGVSQTLMTRALGQALDVEPSEIAHRLMGDWTPDSTDFETLVLRPDPSADLSKPYPFYLAYQHDGDITELGDPSDWFAEYKWDGIRGQVVLRGGAQFLWSRGEELMTTRFPEFARMADFLPSGTVLDGEVLVWRNEAPQPFADLQKRIGRKTVGKKLLAEAPAILRAYDVLDWDGVDWRDRPFAERRAKLEQIIADLPKEVPLRLSPELSFADWEALAVHRAKSRSKGAEGVMIKRRTAPYGTGRRKGDWWKWKVDPLVIDAVMIYAQAGHGRRANLFTDFTFALWDQGALVPFAKAYSGLTDAEFTEITGWVRKHTLQRFGPVRQVEPFHVFELAFEGVQESTRHKSGIAVRFPRMRRWRKDKPAGEANTLDDIKQMLRDLGDGLPPT
jgi:DNA ligase-1